MTTSTGDACAWCDGEIPTNARSDSRYCSKGCRQTTFRLRRLWTPPVRGAWTPARFAYADPPYPGLSRRYYAGEPTYAGEVDHVALVASLMDGGYLGWALSTGAYALREVLPLCPEGVRVCAWSKMNGAVPATKGLHNGWEALIVWRGRQVAPGKRDYLCAKPARSGGTLPGRKPLAFCAWLFECLGMMPGDSLADLFPGTRIVTRAWRHLGGVAEGPVGYASPLPGEASPGARGDPSLRAASRRRRRREPSPAADASFLQPSPLEQRRLFASPEYCP